MRGARKPRRSAVDLRRDSESKRQFGTCVAWHDASLESAKIRTAREFCSSRSSTIDDRLRLLRERVAAKQVVGWRGVHI